MKIAIDAARVRELGNLTDSVSDAQLQPHIENAVSTVKALLGKREPKDEGEEERARVAVCCFAMAYALPVLNSFYLAQADRVPRQIAQTDYVFHEPGEMLKLVEYWRKRAFEVLRDVGRTGGTVGVTII